MGTGVQMAGVIFLSGTGRDGVGEFMGQLFVFCIFLFCGFSNGITTQDVKIKIKN